MSLTSVPSWACGLQVPTVRRRTFFSGSMRKPSPLKLPCSEAIVNCARPLQSGGASASSVAMISEPGLSGPGFGPSPSVRPTGRSELCMKPSGVSASASRPPAYGTGSVAVARRRRPVSGSRCLPLVQ